MTQPYPPQPPQQPYGAPPQWGPPRAPYGAYAGPQGYAAPGQPQFAPPPPPRKPRFGLGARIGMIIGAVVVGAIGNAASGDDETPGVTVPAVTADAAVAAPVPTEPATAAPASPAFPGAQPGDLAVDPGGTLVLDDVAVTAQALAEGDSTFGATLCTTVSYLNNGGDTVSYGAFDWTMQNPNGAIVNLTFFGGEGNFLSTGELAPGGTVTGQVCFEDQNASAGQYVLLYDAPSFFSTERLAWLNQR